MESRIKTVCILQAGLADGGTDTFVVNLCKGLDKTKYQVTIVMPCNVHSFNKREKEVVAAGVRFEYTAPWDGLKGRIVHLWRLFRVLKRGKFDIFQTNVDLFNGLNLLMAYLANVPIRCCHSHNGMRQKSIVSKETLYDKIYVGVSRWLCWHCANRHCGCSEIANEFLYKGYDWQNTDYPNIIYNGIDLSAFMRPINVLEKKNSLGLTNKYNVLTVGRIIPQKNPLFIAKTIGVLLKKREDIDFVWVSDGPLKNECMAIFQNYGVLDRVHFLGFRNDVAEIMKCVDMFYMPSVFEGLPLVLVEAQAAGLKCLCSTNITKMVDCGLIHYMSLSDSDEAWIEAIVGVIEGYIDLKLNKDAISKFSIEKMALDMQLVFS